MLCDLCINVLFIGSNYYYYYYYYVFVTIYSPDFASTLGGMAGLS